MADFKWNDEKKTFELARVGLVEIAKKNIDKYDVRNLVVATDSDLEVIKNARKNINKLVGELSKARKQMKAIVLSQFEPTCIEIEKYGALISNDLTKMINEYKAKSEGEKVKETSYTISISTEDGLVAKKIEKYALKYGCQVITKEE